MTRRVGFAECSLMAVAQIAKYQGMIAHWFGEMFTCVPYALYIKMAQLSTDATALSNVSKRMAV